jgi:hypothetical protein
VPPHRRPARSVLTSLSPLPLAQGHLLGPSPIADTGVGEEHMDVAQLLHGRRHRCVDLGLVGHVTAHGDGTPPHRLDAIGHLARRSLVDVDDGHPGAVLGEGLGHGQAQTGATSGDQGTAALE